MIDEPYRLVEAISNRREYIENELARIFPELPAILGCDLGVFRFLFLVFVPLATTPARWFLTKIL